MGYPLWGFRIEKKSPDFRSPEVGISVRINFDTNGIPYKQLNRNTRTETTKLNM